MSNGAQGIDAMIAKLQKLEDLPASAAAEIRAILLEHVQATAAAGKTPEGEAWAPTKQGKRALVHAAERLTARILPGPIVQIVLRGVEVIHNRGTSRTPARRILPDAGAALPASVIAACKAGAKRAFDRAIGGR